MNKNKLNSIFKDSRYFCVLYCRMFTYNVFQLTVFPESQLRVPWELSQERVLSLKNYPEVKFMQQRTCSNT